MVYIRDAFLSLIVLTSVLNGFAQGQKVDKSVLLQSDQIKSAGLIVPDQLLVKVTSEEMSKEPISSILGGFLFEMGYGDMEGPMWSEMFFNRKFEKFPPYYFDRNWWYQLQDHGKTYLDTDWTTESWYHDGYEHNAWLAAPGSEEPFHIDTSTTFFNESTPLAKVIISPICAPGSDNQFIRISNQEISRKCGLAQQGKWIRKNMTYHFRGSFRKVKGDGKVEILMFPEGNWERPLARIPFVITETTFEEHHFDFDLKNFEGRATFAMFISPGSTVDADNFSLMPADNVKGWRKDAIEAIKQIKPGALRWPGGCFASFYDWRKGVQPIDERIPERSHMWGGWVYHDVGTLEYLNLCELTGCTPFISVNMFNPNKENYTYYDPVDNIHASQGEHFPQYTDIRKGAALAAEWVAYCNAPVTHPMGKLRASQGHPAPFNVKYWELDNELFRWFNTPEALANACVIYSKAMKAVDPTVKLGICTYGKRLSAGVQTMLEIAGKEIDFLADRAISTKNVAQKVDLMHNYNQINGTSVKYTNTEFFTGFDQYGQQQINRFRLEKNERNLDHATWCYALNTANMLMMWQRFGGDVEFSCFNSFVNDHLQSPFEVSKDNVMIKYVGYIYELMNRSLAKWPLKLEGFQPGEQNPFQVQAAFNLQKNKLVLYVYNDTPEKRKAGFNLGLLNQKFGKYRCFQLSCPDALMVRTIKEPNEMTRKENSGNLDGNREYKMEVPPFSFTEIILE